MQAGVAKICRRFLWKEKCKVEPFPFLSPGLHSHILVGTSANTFHLPCRRHSCYPDFPLWTWVSNLPASTGIPPKWLLLHHSW